MLNEQLYLALCRAFGKDNVEVHDEDQEAEVEYRRVPDSENGGTRLIVHDVISQGEFYRLNCPFCGDTRKRLNISHRWCVEDDRTGSKNSFMFHCFNEECQSKNRDSGVTNFRWLYDRIFSKLPGQQLSPLRLNRSRAKPKQESGPVSLPGPHWRLDDLARDHPNHEAVQYLENRLYCPSYLGSQFGVGFCPYVYDMRDTMACRRIVVPVVFRGELATWTARYLGDPPDKMTPKWLHRRGTSTGRLLYNFDRGIQHQTWVLVEGPGDVWSFGTQAMAIFGKAIRSPQVELLSRMASPDTTVVILLDPSWAPDDLKNRREHHIERTFARLNNVFGLHGRVLKVYLPGDRDPGSTDRWFMRDYISWRARQEGLVVDFSKSGKRYVEIREVNEEAQGCLPGFAKRAVRVGRPATNMANSRTRDAQGR